MNKIILSSNTSIKRLMVMVMIGVLILQLVGCGEKTDDTMERVQDLEYTIVQIDDVPEILVEQILVSKQEPFKLSQVDGNYMYIAIGYGTQNTHGYSISVEDFYQSDQYMVVETKLIGPEPNEKVIPENDYPFIVIKTENIGMPICYK